MVRGLEPEVKDHEPWMALDGTEDGLAFYRRIVHESKAWLNPGACIYLEIGYDQGEAVSRLLEAAGFCNIQVIKDLPGLDRVVRPQLLLRGQIPAVARKGVGHTQLLFRSGLALGDMVL